jgi:CyaY protein
MSQDTAFLQSADATLAAIGTALDVALDTSDADIDWSLNDGILEIDCGDDGKLIVNRHGVNREIWVAAKAGGYHFRADGGTWRDTRSRETLAATLARLLRDQADLTVDLSRLPPTAA